MKTSDYTIRKTAAPIYVPATDKCLEVGSWIKVENEPCGNDAFFSFFRAETLGGDELKSVATNELTMCHVYGDNYEDAEEMTEDIKVNDNLYPVVDSTAKVGIAICALAEIYDCAADFNVHVTFIDGNMCFQISVIEQR